MRIKIKNITCLIGALTLSTLSSNAFADDMYTSISGDMTWLEHFDTGGGGNIAIGTRLWPSDYGDFRIEAEAGYHDLSNAHYFTYMGNAYYDFANFRPGIDTNWKITPYVGAGIGDATVHFNPEDGSGRYNEHGDVFAYQFMGGLNFATPAMPNSEWSLGYRYLGSSYQDGVDNAGLSHSDRLSANNIEVAYRFHF